MVLYIAFSSTFTLADSNKSVADILPEFDKNGQLSGYSSDGVRNHKPMYNVFEPEFWFKYLKKPIKKPCLFITGYRLCGVPNVYEPFS